MDFNLSDEQQMLRDGALRYVRENCAFEARRKLRENEEGFSRKRWGDYADLGWLALGLPEDVGGLACSFVETAILMEEFGRGLVIEPYVSTAILCAHILDHCENRALRRAVLGAVAEGRRLLALAHGEPNSRYELTRVGATARRHGERFVLDGVKTLVLDAVSADQFVVSACVDAAAEFSLFLVDRTAPGVLLRAYPLIDGTRAADITLGAVELPSDALLAGPGTAAELVEAAIDRATLACVAEALGAMEATLQITADYIKTRVQFGQPIGRFQALQHRMSEMFVEVQETRSILYQGMAHLDGSTPARRAAVSAAKVVAANAGRIVGGQGIQLHGGIGLTEEYAMGHYYKKLVAFEKTYGDTEWHLRRYIANRR